MGEYHKKLESAENVNRHLAKGFEKNLGDNGVDGFEKWVEKGVWYKKLCLWRQIRGEFFEWDGKDRAKPMSPEEVKAELLKTPSGKFEIRSGWLEANAKWVAAKTGRDKTRLMFPIWEEPKHSSGGDLYLVTPKQALHAEGRGHDIPMVIAHLQPVVGGRGEAFAEIQPETARQRGIKDRDWIKIRSSVGEIRVRCRYYEGVRPDTIVLPMEWRVGEPDAGRWPSRAGTRASAPSTSRTASRVGATTIRRGSRSNGPEAGGRRT